MGIEFDGMPYIDVDPVESIPASSDDWFNPDEFYEPIPRRRQNGSRQGYLFLTDELVQSASPGNSEAWWRDTENWHLALRIRPTGGKSWYFIPHRGEDGRRERLGSASDYTVAEARKKADQTVYRLESERPGPRLRRDMRISRAVAEYFKEHSPSDSDWFKTVESLFNRYLVPRHSDQMLVGMSKAQWLLMVEKASFERPSRGVRLHKALVTFLYWAVERDLIDANPLARTRAPTPPVKEPVRLLPSELRSIYDAAQKLGAPWSVMVGLTMITGEAIEDIRHLRDRDIDWTSQTWTVEWRSAPSAFSSRLRTIRLRAEVLALLARYRDTKGYFFQSPRSLLPRPINFYTEVIERLKEQSGVNSDWGIKDLRGKAVWLPRADREAEDVVL
ncbi:MAG: DUF4102 domain-containing protein [Kiritimatiellae bacterium]|nr:DUF4102 domain-containing protein [Kiritimatiellia bacterium]